MYVLRSQKKELQVCQQVKLKGSHKDTESDILEGKGVGVRVQKHIQHRVTSGSLETLNYLEA